MKRHILPVLLVTSTLIVAVWLVMARKSGQGFKPFDLTARDFVGFEPTLQGWSVRSMPVPTNDPAEPNIAAFVVVSDKGQAVSGKREDGKDSPLGTAAPTLPINPQSRLPNDTPASQHPDTPTPPPSDTSLLPHASQPRLRVLVRLVHGYNMPMCMKIKGYTVVPIGDHRGGAKELSGRKELLSCQVAQLSGRKELLSCQVAQLSGRKELLSCQVAQLLSKSPDGSLPSTTQQPSNLATGGVSPKTSRVSGAQQPSSPTTQQPVFSLTPSSDSDTPPPPYSDTLTVLPHQLWRVTSSDGVSAIWVTTMIRAGDFAPTTVDICSMAFPRVDVADDPRWIPRGFTWTDLRHPVASLRQWGRSRWNASRTDLLTFLRLRQPAWASEELLTYVTSSMSPEVTGDNEADVLRAVEEVHAEMLKALQRWHAVECGGLTPL